MSGVSVISMISHPDTKSQSTRTSEATSEVTSSWFYGRNLPPVTVTTKRIWWNSESRWEFANTDLLQATSVIAARTAYKEEHISYKDLLELYTLSYLNNALSTLIEVMTWCLTAPSHYLNQCWFIINNSLRESINARTNNEILSILRKT